MACDEFVLDLSEFLEVSEPMWSSGEKEGKLGWMSEEAEFWAEIRTIQTLGGNSLSRNNLV